MPDESRLAGIQRCLVGDATGWQLEQVDLGLCQLSDILEYQAYSTSRAVLASSLPDALLMLCPDRWPEASAILSRLAAIQPDYIHIAARELEGLAAILMDHDQPTLHRCRLADKLMALLRFCVNQPEIAQRLFWNAPNFGRSLFDVKVEGIRKVTSNPDLPVDTKRGIVASLCAIAEYGCKHARVLKQRRWFCWLVLAYDCGDSIVSEAASSSLNKLFTWSLGRTASLWIMVTTVSAAQSIAKRALSQFMGHTQLSSKPRLLQAG